MTDHGERAVLDGVIRAQRHARRDAADRVKRGGMPEFLVGADPGTGRQRHRCDDPARAGRGRPQETGRGYRMDRSLQRGSTRAYASGY
jgi:hypothetical protein